MLAVLALLAVQAAPEPATALKPVPPDLAPVFARMLTRTPQFAGVKNRTLDQRLQGFSTPLSPFPLWVVEFHWREKAVTRTGVAMIMDLAAAARNGGTSEAELMKEMSVRDGVWALGGLTEDEDFQQWLARMQAMRAATLESTAVADVRTLIGAQEVFKSVSGGIGYADAACFAAPASCVPGSRPDAFVGGMAELLAPEKSGYRRTFHPGGRVAAKGKNARFLRSWAMTLTPDDPKRRAFCGDSTGRVCGFAGDTEPSASLGACPAGCVAVP